MSIFISPGRNPDAIAVPVIRPPLGYYVRGWAMYFSEYIPGLALLTVLALASRMLAGAVAATYSMLIAIVLGALIRNTFGLNEFFECGTRTYEVFWKVGIVLLGSQMGLQSFQEFGMKGVTLAAGEIVVSMGLTLFLGRIFHIRPSLCCLMAVGMAICGVSAVIALAGALHSDEEDSGYAVSLILLFGLLTLAIMPRLGGLLGLNDLRFGVWAGLSVNNTAEAVATGFVFSETAGHYATIAKLSRNLFLGAALLYFVQRSLRESSAPALRSKLKSAARTFPKFALGMILFSGLATLHFWSPGALTGLNHLYRWAFLLGFAGVGLRTDLARLRRRGFKPLALAFGIQTLVAVIMLGSILIFF